MWDAYYEGQERQLAPLLFADISVPGDPRTGMKTVYTGSHVYPI
jgi:hypothetical protein